MSKHLIIKSAEEYSAEYGIPYDLSETIKRITGGLKYVLKFKYPQAYINKQFGHGMRFSKIRSCAPKQKIHFDHEILWLVLTAPEDFVLDLYSGWETCKIKILYLIDTFPHQYPLIERITKKYKFDLLITSFHRSINDLERITGQQWHGVSQGVDLKRFYPRNPANQLPAIFTASYGRRVERVHQALRKWHQANNLWYEFTTAKTKELSVVIDEHYDCYANHLGNTFANIAWSMETTDPSRGKHLSPVTCRWFEAAASGNVLIGKKPTDPIFRRYFDEDAVVEISENSNGVEDYFEEIYKKWPEYRERAMEMHRRCSSLWSWDSRVIDILNLLDKKCNR